MQLHVSGTIWDVDVRGKIGEQVFVNWLIKVAFATLFGKPGVWSFGAEQVPATQFAWSDGLFEVVFAK